MQQLDLDFVDRDKLLADLCLPKLLTASDASVSARVVKAVLFRLNQHSCGKDETFVGQATLSKETGYGERTVRRAIEALTRLELVAVDLKRCRLGTVCNHYSIRWERVAELCGGVHPELIDEPESATETEAETEAETVPESADAKPWSLPPRTSNSRRRTDRPSWPNGPKNGPTDRPSVQSDRPCVQTDRPSVQSDRPSDGRQRIHTNQIRTKNSMEFDFSGLGSGDGGRLTVADLIEPATVSKLWDVVAKSGAVPNSDVWRLNFFGLCYSLWRNRKALKNPPGMLHYKLRSGLDAILQQVDDERDRAWASKVLRELRGDVMREDVGGVVSSGAVLVGRRVS